MRILVLVGIFVLNMITFHIFGMLNDSFSVCQTESKLKAALSADLLYAISIPSFSSVMNCIEAFSAHVVPCKLPDSAQVFMPKLHQFLAVLNGSVGYIDLFKKINELRKQGFFEDGTNLQLKTDHYLIVNGVENSVRAAMLLMALKIVNPAQVLVYRDISRHIDFNALNVAVNNQLYIDKESLVRLRYAYARVLQNLPMDIVVATKTGQPGRLSLTSVNTSLEPHITSKIQQKVLQTLRPEFFDMHMSVTIDI
jgi:hypothetical protein